MARTSGAISNVGIKLKDLLELLGPTFAGEIVVSKAWFDKLQKPCEYIVHKRDEEPSNVDLNTKAAGAVVVDVRPAFELD